MGSCLKSIFESGLLLLSLLKSHAETAMKRSGRSQARELSNPVVTMLPLSRARR